MTDSALLRSELLKLSKILAMVEMERDIALHQIRVKEGAMVELELARGRLRLQLDEITPRCVRLEFENESLERELRKELKLNRSLRERIVALEKHIISMHHQERDDEDEDEEEDEKREAIVVPATPSFASATKNNHDTRNTRSLHGDTHVYI